MAELTGEEQAFVDLFTDEVNIVDRSNNLIPKGLQYGTGGTPGYTPFEWDPEATVKLLHVDENPGDAPSPLVGVIVDDGSTLVSSRVKMLWPDASKVSPGEEIKLGPLFSGVENPDTAKFYLFVVPRFGSVGDTTGFNNNSTKLSFRHGQQDIGINDLAEPYYLQAKTPGLTVDFDKIKANPDEWGARDGVWHGFDPEGDSRDTPLNNAANAEPPFLKEHAVSRVLPDGKPRAVGVGFETGRALTASAEGIIHIDEETADYEDILLSVTIPKGAPANTPPRAVADQLSAAAGFDARLNVLANDTDAEDGTPTLDAIVKQPSHGTASLDGGAILYSPDNRFFGTDSLVYRVADRGGQHDTAEVTIKVGAETGNSELDDEIIGTDKTRAC